MNLEQLQKELNKIALQCGEHGIGFIAGAVQTKGETDSFIVCQVLSDMSAALPVADLCEDAAARIKDAVPDQVAARKKQQERHRKMMRGFKL